MGAKVRGEGDAQTPWAKQGRSQMAEGAKTTPSAGNGWRRWTPSKPSKGLERVDELLDAVVTSARRKGAKLPFAANTAYVNTISARPSAKTPRRTQDRDDDPPLRALERRRDRAARQQGQFRTRRPHRELPIGRDPVRHRLHAFLARGRRKPRRRPHLLSRAILRRASTPARTWRGGSPRTSSSTSARKLAARACRPIRIPG